ncbi:MAG TPA: BMC domain-containing protein [Tetragenococcus sp.]|nr:BMC domain-containing protein [Tetragenococcus sp.]
MQKALGLIEVHGLLAAIEASDVMVKAAEVKLLSKERVGGGLTTITITGDVAAVQTAVDAASSAVSRLGDDLLSTHVIPRPEINDDFFTPLKKQIVEDSFVEAKRDEGLIVKEDQDEAIVVDELPNQLTEEKVIQWIQEDKEKAAQKLANYRVVDLRFIAKKHEDLIVSKKEFYKMSKEKLINTLIEYFSK